MTKAHQLAENFPAPIEGHGLVAGENDQYENRQMIETDMAGAAPGKTWVLNPDLKTARLITSPDFSASEDYLNAGRIFVADGASITDYDGAPIIVLDADPLTDDLWEGAIAYSRASKAFFGPKGRVSAGVWGAGWKPWEAVSGSTPTEKLNARWVSIATIPQGSGNAVIAQLEGIESVGTWTQNANGIAFPEDGTYSIHANVGLANNTGSEGVLNGQFLLDGSAPATGPTGSILERRVGSRFPLVPFDTEWTVAAGQVLALSLYSAATDWSLNGIVGGITIKRTA